MEVYCKEEDESRKILDEISKTIYVGYSIHNLGKKGRTVKNLFSVDLPVFQEQYFPFGQCKPELSNSWSTRKNP